MSPEEIEQLLYQEESAILDFKRDQYAFSKATPEEKSELLKDIVGFANGWRPTEAIILIGVKKVQGGRSEVYGVASHLDDHALQQFVNNALNRPLQFAYEAAEIEGKQVGIIRIAKQRRPVWLKNDYGKLKKDKVYVRRGTSTDPSKSADPDEIASMGKDTAAPVSAEPSFTVTLVGAVSNESLPTPLPLESTHLIVPKPSDLPDQVDRGRKATFGGREIYAPQIDFINGRVNRDFYRKATEFIKFHRAFSLYRIAVTNTATVAARDVVVEIINRIPSGFQICSYAQKPPTPERRGSNTMQLAARNIIDATASRRVGGAQVEDQSNMQKLQIAAGLL